MGHQLKIGEDVKEINTSSGNYYLYKNELLKSSLDRIDSLGYILASSLVTKSPLESYESEVLKYFNIDSIYAFSPIRLEFHAVTLQDKEEKPKFIEISPIGTKFEPIYNNLGEEWFHKLKLEFVKPYMLDIIHKLQARRIRKIIYPSSEDIWNCFKLVPYRKVNVVIVGQEPYAFGATPNGLAFSSSDLTCTHPTTKKIFETMDKEVRGNKIKEDNPDLTYLAEQGVFLINTHFTVEKDNVGSHREWGWKQFTARVLQELNQQNELVYLLWGNAARGFSSILNNPTSLVIECEHPAFPAYSLRDWENNNCFKKTNSFLEAIRKSKIDW